MAHTRLEGILHHLAHHLPAQGPIGVFIHHNTLHAFQHLPFDQAVLEASRLFHTEPYMMEAAYRRQLTLGRIRGTDLDAVLAAEGIDIRIRRVMLDPGHRNFRPETIRWEIEENGLLDADRALFEFWLARSEARPWTLREEPHHDAVNSLLIKLCGAFLDQGMAYWPMPDREQGFWKAALTVLSQPGAVRGEELASAGRLAREWRGKTAEQAIHAALAALGVEEEQQEEFLEHELQSLPGWAGLMHQLEQDPALFPHERVPASLMDFVAVRLLLVVAGREEKEDRPRPRDFEGERLAEAATLMDVTLLTRFDWKNARDEQAAAFRRSVLAFDELERRRVWHAAYERRHERQILLPFQQHGAAGPVPMPARLAAQVFFCIDEREESIRRALEEADPEIETFGAAGFFGVPMNYAGLDDAHGVSLCPVVVKPKHAIRERPVEGHEDNHGRRRALRRAWARVARESFVSSRTLVRGWLGTSVLGVFALFPLAARILSPRRYAKLVGWLNSSVLPEPRTELVFSRTDDAGHQVVEGFLGGFSIPEKIDCVAAVLGPAGLRRGMARLVVVLGHGSTSLNNPHESAHDCGACGGRRGGPNARLFAAMANHPEVRRGLRERDIHIPDDTWFIGGYHDTCNDDIELYDLEALPSSHRGDFDRVRASLDEARARSAHERTRRFEAASGSPRPIAGLHHVQERAEHLAEPRPEYGHCTNAVCFVGRRAGTRGLFLDRRAFLVSYDATQDPDNGALGRVLGAVIPVCGGISLEYYFSFVDNERYGCGTKLPHNVTGLVGVMNGSESDLRTGLPWQMVEIHEPVRILFVVETTPDRVLATIQANPLLTEFLENRWIRLATVDPADATRIHVYRGAGQWERLEGPLEGPDEKLGQAPGSLEYYHGHIEHLPMARLEMAGAPTK